MRKRNKEVEKLSKELSDYEKYQNKLNNVRNRDNSSSDSEYNTSSRLNSKRFSRR